MKSSKIKPARHSFFKKTPSGSFIVNLKMGVYYVINETGALIWEEMKKGKTPRQISGRVAKEFGITRARAKRETDDYLRRLEKEKLITTQS